MFMPFLRNRKNQSINPQLMEENTMQDLKEVIKAAAEIAKQVPENLQEAAFNRALDLLTMGTKSKTSLRKSNRKAVPKRSNVSSGGVNTADANPSDSAKKPKKSSGLGPKPAITALIDAGFFNAPQPVSAIREYLKKKRGYDIDSKQLSTALLRLVREELLERDENENGQLVYKKP
jgi:hypothetical protein